MSNDIIVVFLLPLLSLWYSWPFCNDRACLTFHGISEAVTPSSCNDFPECEKRIHVAILIHAVAFSEKRGNRASPKKLGFVNVPRSVFAFYLRHTLSLPLLPQSSPHCTLPSRGSLLMRHLTDWKKQRVYFLVFRMKHSAYYRLVGQRSLLSEGLIYEDFCSVGAAESQVY